MSVAPTNSCRNCGAQIEGAFCSQCGQKHLSNGLNIPEIASELLDTVVKPDSRLWTTFLGLTRNPGHVASEYADGKRARYVNPVRYCIAGIAASAAATIATGEFEQIGLSMLPEGGGSSSESIKLFTSVFAKYLNILAILSVPIYTVCLRLFFLRSGRNMAEIFSFSCFVVGHVSLLGVVATFVNSYVYFMGLWPSMIVNFGITIYAAHVFFRRKFGYTFLAMNMSYMIYLVVLSGLFWVLYSYHAS
ncbi:MAG: DUF3667 domain-containing protein [Alphaproteobacteria bacterium]|nr:DUF3667 domain-containing protein [Alphaproteobacteria bacterium]